MPANLIVVNGAIEYEVPDSKMDAVLSVLNECGDRRDLADENSWNEQVQRTLDLLTVRTEITKRYSREEAPAKRIEQAILRSIEQMEYLNKRIAECVVRVEE